MTMQTYRRSVAVANEKGEISNLVVERLPDHWHAQLFNGPDYDTSSKRMTVTQPATDVNGGFEHLSDDIFLDRVKLVFDFSMGVRFDYAKDAA